MMERVMTGVGIEPTTYGLKERDAATTFGVVSSERRVVGGASRSVKTPEASPKKGAVCDGMCMAESAVLLWW